MKWLIAFLGIFKEFHCEKLAEKDHDSFFDIQNIDIYPLFYCRPTYFSMSPVLFFKDTYPLF